MSLKIQTVAELKAWLATEQDDRRVFVSQGAIHVVKSSGDSGSYREVDMINVELMTFQQYQERFGPNGEAG